MGKRIMTIEDAQLQKNTLAEVIRDLIAEFEQETGLTVDRIEVERLSAATMGEPNATKERRPVGASDDPLVR